MWTSVQPSLHILGIATKHALVFQYAPSTYGTDDQVSFLMFILVLSEGIWATRHWLIIQLVNSVSSLAITPPGESALEGFTESFLKEMAPEQWNITGAIIEPGGFDNEWKGASAKTIPPHPAYTDAGNPCS